MKRADYLLILGVALIVVGFGGGVELTLIAQSNAYEAVMRAGGQANVGELANQMHASMFYVKVGIPVGMAGVILLAIALRAYLVRASKGTAVNA